MKKKLTILLIPPEILPIPAVGGGAIETLITSLLEKNEVYDRIRLIVISKYDSTAASTHYRNSKVYYLENGKLADCSVTSSYILREYMLKIVNRIKNKLERIGVSWKIFEKELIDCDHPFFTHYLISIIEKVDVVINEGDWQMWKYDIFNQLVGREHVFYHIHCTIPERLDQRRIISNSISISNYVKNAWVKDNNICGNNLVLYNGINMDKFSVVISPEVRKQYRDKIGVSDDDFLVVFCGRIIPEKGINELLDAFGLLDNKSIKLMVIGSVAFSENTSTEFSEAMRLKAEKMDTIFWMGYIANDDLPHYYKAADIMVVPSVWEEGAGLVSIEGMAMGLPLIVTDTGGMVEYVDEKCSIKVPVDYNLSNSLKDAILKLYDDEDLRKRMSISGRERARRFNDDSYYSNFVNLFK